MPTDYRETGDLFAQASNMWLPESDYSDEQIRDIAVSTILKGSHEAFHDVLRLINRTKGIPCSDDIHFGKRVRTGVYCLLSARAGKPVHYEFAELIQVAHHMTKVAKDGHEFCGAFARLLHIHGHDAAMSAHDRDGGLP